MKRFNITVNGKAYDVAVEEIGGTSAPVAAAAPTPAAAPADAPAPAANVEGTKVTAPMPGNILNVKVNVGDEVSEGQVLLVLEAMKMENDIPATVGGKVAAINVKKGDTVNSNDVLVVIQ